MATFGDTSDYAILTRSITNLRQLEGKTLGYHAQFPVVLTEMLEGRQWTSPRSTRSTTPLTTRRF